MEKVRLLIAEKGGVETIAIELRDGGLTSREFDYGVPVEERRYRVSLPGPEGEPGWEIGDALVRRRRVRDYRSEVQIQAFLAAGLRPDDRVSSIVTFYPTEPKEIRNLGVGGRVMREILEDCADSAAVHCFPCSAEMVGLLTSKFGFEHFHEGDFIKLLRTDGPAPTLNRLQRDIE